MKTLTERMQSVAQAIDAIVQLSDTDIVCVSVFTDFVVVQVGDEGAAKLTAKLGAPVRDGHRMLWVNPDVKREPWHTDDTFRWLSSRWPGRIELVVSPAPVVPGQTEPMETPAVIEDGFVVVDSNDIPTDDNPF